MFSLRRDRTTHCKFLLITELNQLPKLLFVSHFLMNVVFCSATCQWMQGFPRSASLNSLVTTENFSPSFFENEHPYFIFRRTRAACPAERPLISVSIIGKSIIYHDNTFDAVDVQFNSIAASFVNFLS